MAVYICLGRMRFWATIVFIGILSTSCGLPLETTGEANHPPTISLLGNSLDTTVAGIPYAEPSATATDVEDGNLFNVIYFEDGLFNRNSPAVGTYQILYHVTDRGGLSDSVYRTIVVIGAAASNHAPVLTLRGKAIDTIAPGVAYMDSGATAQDLEEGNLTTSVEPRYGSFNRQNPAVGNYQIFYIVVDQGGLADTAMRSVVVKTGIVLFADTIQILEPVVGSTVYKDTTKIYLIPETRLTIPAGASITFGAHVKVVARGKILVNGALAIDTGSLFLMGKDACIETYSGTLKILGSDSFPVFFKNLTPGVFWGNDPSASAHAYASYGIYLSTNANGNSSIQYCVVDSSTTAINIAKDGVLLSNIITAESKYSGMYFDGCGPRDSTSFVNIYFIANGSSPEYYPLAIDAEHLGRLSDSLAFVNNAVDAVLVKPVMVTSSAIWKSLTVPYVINAGSYINIENATGVTISIVPGAQFKFMVDTYIKVGKGTFIANGTTSKHILFDTWVSGTKWGGYHDASNYSANYGIYFSADATSLSALTYCDVNNATQGVTSYDSPAHVANCSFSNNTFYGLYATAAGKAGMDVSSCIFSNNGAGNYYLAP